MADRSRDRPTCPCAPHQDALALKGLSAQKDVIERYLEWVSCKQEAEQAKGNYLPSLAYDPDEKCLAFL